MVRAGRAAYYVGDLVPGRADGTGVAGESPGLWTGGGADMLGLRGPVTAAPFGDLLEGRDPLGDRPLRHVPPSRGVAGFDLVFCAPKSVSVLHLLGARELAAAVGSAHHEAVSAAAAHLEREGFGVRRTTGGRVRRVASTGMVAAGFVHRTSRSLDPHLHTHLVAANVAQGVDGLWSTVDSRRLFLYRRAAEGLYHSVLRHALAVGIGAAWVPGPSGRPEVSGVDPVLCRRFSTRAAGIEEQVHRAPGSLGRAAFHVDRPEKDGMVTFDEVRADWRRRARDHGIDLGELVRVVGRGRPDGPDARVDHARLGRGLEELAARRSLVTRRDLLAALTEALPQGAPAPAVDRMAAALTEAAGPVAPGSARPAGVDVAEPAEQRWSALAVARSLRLHPEVVDRARLGVERSRVDRPFGRGAPADDISRGLPSPLEQQRDLHSGWDRTDRAAVR